MSQTADQLAEKIHKKFIEEVKKLPPPPKGKHYAICNIGYPIEKNGGYSVTFSICLDED